MSLSESGLLDLPDELMARTLHNGTPERNGWHHREQPSAPPDAEHLRHCAWVIGERNYWHSYASPSNHVGLGMVTPGHGFAHWRIRQEWIDEIAWHKGAAWQNCRLVLRLYDVSYIHFDGFNAHSLRDYDLPCICGHMFFNIDRLGSHQIGEVGFLLRHGEFVPAARSQVAPFPPDRVCARGDHAALLVDERGQVEEVGNLWDQERILIERRKPKLRQSLRIAAFAFASLASGQQDSLARFVSELASNKSAQGHEVHVFVPATEQLPSYREVDGVHYQPLEVNLNGSPLEQAQAFAEAAQRQVPDVHRFDLLHLHEWMTGMVPWVESCPSVVSFTSLEKVRRNGTPIDTLSREIQLMEQKLAHSVNCLLTPEWLRDVAVADFGVDGNVVHGFPMEGRLSNEWDCPLDYGQVKKNIGFGPLDRLLLFIGPLDYAAGVDLLIEALPVALRRTGNVRVAYVGDGHMRGHLAHRMHELGVAHAVRLLGHMEGPFLVQLLRAAEALLLPSRYRVPFDDAVVDLARRAGRPVVTTHSGPSHLVRHEETGVITYDNPGSMVWAMDRILSDPDHIQRMGHNGKRDESSVPNWSEVVKRYFEICAARFPELREK